MDRKEFKSLSDKERIEFFESEYEKGILHNQILKLYGLAKNTVADTFKRNGYAYDRSLGRYTFKEYDKSNTKVVPKEEVILKYYNDNTFKKEMINIISWVKEQQKKQEENEELLAWIKRQRDNENIVDESILNTSLSTILVGGEKMNSEFANRFKNINLINIYGPTEGTVWTSMKRVNNNYSNIGRPFPNYQHVILNKKNKLLPSGAVGELCISGPQLTRGYYKNEDLTQKKYISNPFNKDNLIEYKNLYKTGDIVRKLPNDDFELLGRNDFQVKIRGYRIELAEVEDALTEIKSVQQALAVVNEVATANVLLHIILVI